MKSLKKPYATKNKTLLGSMLLILLATAAAVFVLQRYHSPASAPAANNGSVSDAKTGAKPTPNQAGNGKPAAGANNSASQANGPDATSTDVAPSAITITANGFEPASLTTKKDTTIRWTNNDSSAHALDPAEDSTGPHSPQLKSGESYSYSFAKAGSYRYIDVMQPSHGGTITITD